jgi:hypothetical protein
MTSPTVVDGCRPGTLRLKKSNLQRKIPRSARNVASGTSVYSQPLRLRSNATFLPPTFSLPTGSICRVSVPARACTMFLGGGERGLVRRPEVISPRWIRSRWRIPITNFSDSHRSSQVLKLEIATKELRTLNTKPPLGEGSTLHKSPRAKFLYHYSSIPSQLYAASKLFSTPPHFVFPVGIPNNTSGLPSPAGLSTLKYPFLSN